jgi:hypothetical protein
VFGALLRDFDSGIAEVHDLLGYAMDFMTLDYGYWGAIRVQDVRRFAEVIKGD